MAVKGGGRRVVQVVASLAACLCLGSVGHCVPLSAYLLPQAGTSSPNKKFPGRCSRVLENMRII